MTTKEKLSSRKFWLAQQIIVLIMGVPVLFQHFGIDSAVTLLALGAITGIGGFYGVCNVLDKKYEGGSFGKSQSNPNGAPRPR